jgi:hypothetical protein
MVKEEDKGRGCMIVHGMYGCFHPDFFRTIPEMLDYLREIKRNKKNLLYEVFFEIL